MKNIMHSDINQPGMEEKYLKISSYGALFFAALAFILGLVLRSQVILFDGLYSIISVVLSFLSLMAYRFMKKTDHKRFPFGKDSVEPLIILTKYLALIALVVGSLISAVISIFQGGREIAIGAGLLYAFIALLYCYAMQRLLTRANRRLSSNLLKTEASEWHLDTMVSLGVLIGFILAYGFTFFPALLPYQSYVDPTMMILVSLYFIKYPIIEIKKALGSLLDMRPSDNSGSFVDSLIKSMEEQWKFQRSIVRVARPGKNLWVEVDFIVGDHNLSLSIKDQDRIRREITEKIAEKYSGDHWITVSFTNEEEFAV